MSAAPVYLFTGPEFGERNDAVLNLRIQMRKRLGDLDEYTFYTADTRVADVVSLLMNESLFAAARFIVLNGAEQIKKKEDLELLDGWIRSAASGKNAAGSALILVSEENSCDKKLEALIPKENKRIFWEMFDDRKEEWIRNFFKKAGYGVENDAVTTILDLVENNTEALRTECSRFFLCFDKGHTVGASDVEQILAHNREESPFTLFDAFTDLARNPAARLEASLEILQKLRMSKDSSGVQLIAGLTYCFRRLAVWHRLFAENPHPSDFDLKIKGFSSKKAQKQYRAAARIWNAPQTSLILAALARTDMDIRTAGTALEDTQLQLLLYAIVMKNGETLEREETESEPLL
ncbi:DNA polymerase III subunit delta [Treponema brennaborense]|uniref:DNA-directed DNA polymerase n=1 Tax=Treponema brennaborense (strain DSM 12168 / CIP 105900 / DD5/3) TaxID=906968 RepID=F4LKI8_TREBD|nr:DNA polymerase III subunit delta [Treponema brennaborense]AEE17544.1 DNA polymerase III, delta subunit [Treponema brennaborense DSM 12168]